MVVHNPSNIVETGAVTGEGFKIQQNGIDLTVRSIEKIKGQAGRLMETGDSNPSSTIPIPVEDGLYTLNRGNAYSVITNQKVKVPGNMCAMILQRSTLNRMGVFAQAGLYDSGFDNYIGFTLYAFNKVQIEEGARVAQIVFLDADATKQYNGKYQAQ